MITTKYLKTKKDIKSKYSINETIHIHDNQMHVYEI